jgi:hypothetical protein
VVDVVVVERGARREEMRGNTVKNTREDGLILQIVSVGKKKKSKEENGWLETEPGIL